MPRDCKQEMFQASCARLERIVQTPEHWRIFKTDPVAITKRQQIRDAYYACVPVFGASLNPAADWTQVRTLRNLIKELEVICNRSTNYLKQIDRHLGPINN